jgi:Raf kinase inhibitor-like YbhB/YbcL family protein
MVSHDLSRVSDFNSPCSPNEQLNPQRILQSLQTKARGGRSKTAAFCPARNIAALGNAQEELEVSDIVARNHEIPAQRLCLTKTRIANARLSRLCCIKYTKMHLNYPHYMELALMRSCLFAKIEQYGSQPRQEVRPARCQFVTPILRCTKLLSVILGAIMSNAVAAAEFKLASPDLVSGAFAERFVAKGFGCTGDNVSPALSWSGAPAGAKSFALTLHDPDAPTGSGFWHWVVTNIPADTTGLVQGAGNGALPPKASSGSNDFHDTGANGSNGNYGGPCPPAGDPPHRYVFTIYALSVDDLYAAAGVPKTVTPAVHGFLLNRALGDKVLAKASLTARYGR